MDMKNLIHLKTPLFILLFALASCNTQEQPKVEVEHFGALKIMMHKGDISAKANLQDFASEEHLYALGALENLKGEILILDSEPFISSVHDSALSVDHSFDHGAALLVKSQVHSWNEYAIPEDITEQEHLEVFIEKTAQANGLDTAKPFPFLLEGTVESFDWHVIDWPEGDTEHSHQKHVNSGLNGTIHHTDVTILGFYSRHHHRIFTHHSTNVHMHVKSATVTGHVDGLILGKDMTLKLPKTQ